MTAFADQLGLFASGRRRGEDEVPAVADQVLGGVVLHLPGGSIRLRGRAADSRWVAARCDRAGADLRPERLVVLPADEPTLTGILRRRVA